MRRQAPIAVPPTQTDIAVSRLLRKHAAPAEERAVKILTFAADEKPLLAASILYWLLTHAGGVQTSRSRANHLLLCTAASAALPHLLKHIFDRERPDRTQVHGPRQGIPRSGNAMDSFPSGHALHLGALAAGLARTASTPAAAFGWMSAFGLASTRLLLLAHYLTDVVAGLALGAALEWLLAAVCGRRR
jgi:membrane-associated phospholipid phosphatase